MIQVLERAFNILRLVSANSEKPVRVSDLARKLGINQTTCTNIVQALVRNGYLETAAGSRSYILGPEPFRLTRANSYLHKLIDIAQPHMQHLVEEVDETCLLARLSRWKKVILCKVDRDSPFRLRLDYMEEQDPYTTATGRLLIAHLNPRERARMAKAQGLPSGRWDGISSVEELEEACAKLRTMDCYSYGPCGSELIGIAAGICSNGIIAAALGVFLPVSRFTGKHKKRILNLVIQTAKKISCNLCNGGN